MLRKDPGKGDLIRGGVVFIRDLFELVHYHEVFREVLF
jgi:hypothetical protein